MVIPDTVIRIEHDAFRGCTSLTEVTIPHGIEMIPWATFYRCTSLSNIRLPAGITNLEAVFIDCTSLSEVTIPPGVVDMYSTFLGCTSLTNVTIPEGVTSIAAAFYGCTSLATVSIPNSVTNLNGTFRGCANLKDIEIGSNVTSIHAWAFEDCTSLTDVTIPSSVVEISRWAFLGCANLTAIEVDPLNPVYQSTDGVVFDRGQTTLVLLPTGRGSDYAIPDGVISVESSAFFECNALVSVRVPASVTSIDNFAFNGCAQLSALTVDPLNPVYRSRDGVLFDKAGTTLLWYPTGKAGDYIIPQSVIEIAPGAFFNCAGLTGVKLPSGLDHIADWAFEGCASLTDVDIPGSVITIGWQAFAHCTSLTEITIPNSVMSITDGAFYGSTNLAGIHFWGDAPDDQYQGSLGAPAATLYRLPGTAGWTPEFRGHPVALWELPNPVILSTGPGFGVQTNAFGFIISWAAGGTVVVEVNTDLADPDWMPAATNILVDGWSYSSDPDWTSAPNRFYRLLSP